MVLERLRSRKLLLAAVPVLALGIAGAGAVTAAHADEPSGGGAGQQAAKNLRGAFADAAATKTRQADPAIAATSVFGDWNGDSRADILTRDAVGRLWFYRGTGNIASPYRPRVQVGRGWQIYNALIRHGDFDRDGHQDLLARDGAGKFWLYRGTGAADGTGYLPRRLVGGGWQIYRHIFGADDWTGDGFDDLAAVDTAGRLWLYEGKGLPTPGVFNPFLPRRQVGRGWQIYNLITALGDLTGDGGSELLARQPNGQGWSYDTRPNPASPLSPRQDAGTGWNELNAIAGVGDLSGGGVNDILVRELNGNLFLIDLESSNPAPQIGRGWNIYNVIF